MVEARRWSSRAAAMLGVLLLAYPILVYGALQHFPPALVGAVMLCLIAFRLGLTPQRSPLLLAGIVAAGILLVMLLVSPLQGIRLYPVVVSLSVAAVFAATLVHPPTAIERIARLSDPDLSPAGVAYTRNVTIVWLGFLLVNAAISAWTALYASLETWTLYNGLLSYIAMGILFAGEFLVRRRIMRGR